MEKLILLSPLIVFLLMFNGLIILIGYLIISAIVKSAMKINFRIKAAQYEKNGDLERALDYYKKDLRFKSVLRVAEQLADDLRHRGEYERARDLSRQAYDLVCEAAKRYEEGHSSDMEKAAQLYELIGYDPEYIRSIRRRADRQREEEQFAPKQSGKDPFFETPTRDPSTDPHPFGPLARDAIYRESHPNWRNE